MAKAEFQIQLSYSQLCVFQSSLSAPFNDWGDQHFRQGFAWREGSASFRALREDGVHNITLYINEPLPELPDNVVRAFKVPFDASDGNIEIASISDSTELKIPSGIHSLQVEFLGLEEGQESRVNVRLNSGKTDFSVLKADVELDVDGSFDTAATPAT